MTTGSDRSGRRMLLMIAALFLVPLGAAFWLYYGGGWRPAGHTEHGDLIEPSRPLPAVSLPDPDGRGTPPDLLRHVWTMVYIGDGRCDARCRRAL